MAVLETNVEIVHMGHTHYGVTEMEVCEEMFHGSREEAALQAEMECAAELRVEQWFEERGYWGAD